MNYAADELVLALHKQQKRGTSEAGVKHEDGPEPPAKLPKLRRRPTWVAAHRFENAVYFRRLELEEFLTLVAIREGLSLGDALQAGFRDSAKPEAKRLALVRAWFAHWAELGWICAPELDALFAG